MRSPIAPGPYSVNLLADEDKSQKPRQVGKYFGGECKIIIHNYIPENKLTKGDGFPALGYVYSFFCFTYLQQIELFLNTGILYVDFTCENY